MTMCMCLVHCVWGAYFIYILYILCVPCIYVWGHVFWNLSLKLFKHRGNNHESIYIVNLIYGMHLTCLMSRYILYIINICSVYLVCFRYWCILYVCWTVYILCILCEEHIVYTQVYIMCDLHILRIHVFWESYEIYVRNFQTQKEQLINKEHNLYTVCDLCILYLTYNICELHILCGYVIQNLMRFVSKTWGN